MDYASVLRNTDIFKDLSDDELRLVAALCSRETHQDGAMLAQEGDPAEKLYVVEEGHVQFQIATGAGRLWTIASSQQGECFGWKAFLDQPHIWASNARCVEATTLTTVDGAGLQELCRSRPRIGFVVISGIALLISRRLDETRRQLAHVADRIS